MDSVFKFFKFTEIAWSIYESLRVATVDLGLYPDLALNPTPTQVDTDVQTLYTNGVNVVRVSPVQPIRMQGGTDYGQMFLTLVDFEKGTLGAGNAFTYVQQGNGRYNETAYNDYTHNINIMVTCIASNALYLDTFNEVIKKAFGYGICLLQGWDIQTAQYIADKSFELEYLDTANVTVTDMFEIKYLFKARDVFLGENTLTTDVPQITTIESSITAKGQSENID